MPTGCANEDKVILEQFPVPLGLHSDFRWYTDEHFFNSNLLAKKELAHDFTSNALNEANFFFTLFFFFGHGLQHAGS